MAEAVSWSRRPSRPQDRDLHVEIYAAAVPELAAVDLEPAQRFALVTAQSDLQLAAYRGAYPDTRIDILWVGDEAVGRIITADTADAVLVLDIQVLPPWRGRGIGAAVLRQEQSRASRGDRVVRLSVLVTNRAARRLYERLGFREFGSDGGAHVALVWSPTPSV